ncbi:methyl-accepting chemotaxis protein [Motiliproteus coralliicola]|uniref:Methyl-accepting chemotaxis protein n=1 Tax=Motiliproteus coralliicola TaxID=2283196 RepID=A0A369WAU6_9GAMM|nr:methyl-accepting chemotaxis protein [Motiliproteus coralliicola]RDE19130.1 methyl-accepting chemotaxis protein [Motiliproteus coralliicola]
MRIATLSRSTTTLMLIASIGMAVSVYWGLRQLQQPFELNQHYYQVASQVSVQTRQLIDNYISTGNAADLQRAQTFLNEELSHSMTSLPDKLRQTLEPALEALKQGLDNELRAAGKLAGNPQELLIQNERESIDAVELLQDYASQAPAESLEQAKHLATLAQQYLAALTRRALLRSSYFSTRANTSLKDSLITQSAELQQLAEQIRSLPPLGVWQQEEEDEFAAMMGLEETDTERTEIGQEHKDNLAFLSRRYPDELTRTLQWQQDGLAARQQVDRLIGKLEQRLKDGQQVVEQLKQQIEQQVMLMMAALLLLLFISVGTTAWVQLITLKGMGKVGGYLKHLASGDFSRQMAENKSYQELNELRQSANQLQGYMKELVSEIRAEVQAVEQASNGIDQVALRIHQGSVQQNQRTSEADNAIAELVASFQQVADHAQQASGAADQGQQSVKRSAEVMQQLESAIGQLSEEVSRGSGVISQLQQDTQSIEAVLNVIVSIAEQTNLLALNAAIEAARAGEHGRGFAVVADEVRGLAQRTSDSIEEIRGIIEGLGSSSKQVVSAMGSQQQNAEHCVEQTRDAVTQLQQVVSAIDSIHNMNLMIAQTTEQQAGSAEAVRVNVSDIQQHSEAAAEQTNQARQQSDQLTRISTGLQGLVERFVV